jgi:DNA-directed RNA polymerase subunit RPC12/RpoP
MPERQLSASKLPAKGAVSEVALMMPNARITCPECGSRFKVTWTDGLQSFCPYCGEIVSGTQIPCQQGTAGRNIADAGDIE